MVMLAMNINICPLWALLLYGMGLRVNIDPDITACKELKEPEYGQQEFS